MHAFDPDPSRLGLPNAITNQVARQDTVTNANVYSNNPNVTEVIGSATVNLEMWSTNYANADSPAIPNGTDRFDWCDTGFGIGGGHGASQIPDIRYHRGGISRRSVFSCQPPSRVIR
jgi:hypothetical protein